MATNLVCLDFLENVQLLFGLKLKPRSRVARVLNYICRFHLIVSSFYIFLFCAHWMIRNERKNDKFYLLGDIYYIYYYMVVTLATISYSRKLDSIYQFQQRLMRLIPDNDSHTLNRIGSGLIAIGLVGILGKVSSLLVYFIHQSPPSVIQANLGKWFVSSSSLVNYFVAIYSMIYVFIPYAFFMMTAINYLLYSYLVKEVVIGFYRKYTTRPFTQQMVSENHQIIDCIEEFESLFNVYPFIWTSCLFFKTSAMFVFLALSNSDNSSYTTHQLIEYSSYVMVIGFVLIKTIHFTDEIIEHKRNLQKRFELMRLQNQPCDLTKSTDLVLFTVWKMAPIDRSFIITFIGQVTSFSVLFSSLANIK